MILQVYDGKINLDSTIMAPPLAMFVGICIPFDLNFWGKFNVISNISLYKFILSALC